MENMGMIIVGIGWVLAVIGSIWFLVKAFQESVLWGLSCLLISPVSFFFLIVHFNEAAKPFGLSLLGLALIYGPVLLYPEVFA